MIITSVSIENFKIFKKQRFDFEDNKMVLITGANGFGKTSLIDAIEWCLTGNIARVKNSYEQRNTTKTEKERTENNKGIIKNSSCTQNDKIKVTINLKLDDIEVEVYREQKNDDLNSKTTLCFGSTVTDEIIKKIYKNISEDTFYSYHICDTHKAFDFLNRSRHDVKEQFEDFLRSRPLVDAYNNMLTNSIEVMENLATATENKKTPLEKIDTYKQDLQTMKNEINQVLYPKIKFYNDEILEIEKEDVNSINIQKKNLIKCGYNFSTKLTDRILLHIESSKRYNLLDESIKLGTNLGKDIDFTIKNKYYSTEVKDAILAKNTNILADIEELKKTNKICDINTHIFLKYLTLQDAYNKANIEINDLTIKSEKISEEINERENGNKIIEALSNLYINREALIAYKNEGYNNCPLCGADTSFKDVVSYDELAVNAKEYLEKSDSYLVLLREEKNSYDNQIVNKFKILKKFINDSLNDYLSKLEKQHKIYNEYSEKTKSFFSIIKLLNIEIDDNLMKRLIQEKDTIKKYILSKDTFDEYKLLLNNILLVIQCGYDINDESYENFKKLRLKLSSLCDDSFVVNDVFTFEDYNKKLLYLDNIILNQKIIEKQSQIEIMENENKVIDEKISKYRIAGTKARNICKKIDSKTKEIEKLEVESVGPYLFNIYSKIIKHPIFNNFELTRDNARTEGGVTLKDDNGNNIMNTFSQGQLGVLVVSYFLANAFRRYRETEFRTYFFDDITNCLDDMNILSFCDLIKYQLYNNNGVINQFFFSTCNDDLEKLLIHKMESFNITYKLIKFESYAEVSK